MTIYTAIPDSDIDPESPGTTTLFTRLRDNPLAIREGDATAPKILNAALNSYPFSIAAGDISDGVWALLESWTPTATGSHDFTWDEATYSEICILIEGVRTSSSGDNLLLQFGYSNGGTIITSSTYDYSIISVGATAVTGATGQSSIKLNVTDSIGNSPTHGISSNIMVTGTKSGVNSPIAHYDSSYVNTGGISFADYGAGFTDDSVAGTNNIDTVRITWQAGNFIASAGNISLFGVIRG